MLQTSAHGSLSLEVRLTACCRWAARLQHVESCTSKATEPSALVGSMPALLVSGVHPAMTLLSEGDRMRMSMAACQVKCWWLICAAPPAA